MIITIPAGSLCFRRSTRDFATITRAITVEATWEDGYYLFYYKDEQWEYYPL